MAATIKGRRPLEKIKQMVKRGKATSSKMLTLTEKEEAYFREISIIEKESKKSDYTLGGPVTF
jgi:hypothetical protein